jgi:hypothetical protein
MDVIHKNKLCGGVKMKDVTEIKRFSGNLAVSDIAIILTKHLIFALFGFYNTEKVE